VKAVNLLPREEGKAGSRRFDPLVVGGVVLTVAVVAGTAGGFLVEHSHASSAQQQLSAAQSQLAQAKARRSQESSQATTPVVTPPSVTSQATPWREAVASALSTRIAWDHVLSEFAQVVPSDITLTNLSMSTPEAAAAAVTGSTTSSSSGAFTLTGTAFSEDSVARLLSRLMLVPELTGVELNSSTKNTDSGVITFGIQATVKGSATPSSDTTTTTTTASPQ